MHIYFSDEGSCCWNCREILNEIEISGNYRKRAHGGHVTFQVGDLRNTYSGDYAREMGRGYS